MGLQRLRLGSQDPDGEEVPQDIWDGCQQKGRGCTSVGESCRYQAPEQGAGISPTEMRTKRDQSQLAILQTTDDLLALITLGEHRLKQKWVFNQIPFY